MMVVGNAFIGGQEERDPNAPAPRKEKVKNQERAHVSVQGKIISTAGLILLDSSLQPIYASPEALQILSYPESPRKARSREGFLANRIRQLISDRQLSMQATFAKDLMSGRRRYLERTFRLESWKRICRQPAIAVLLERDVRAYADLTRFAERFRLSQREREAVECLLEGLTTKEIATRMFVSANTVKAFLRLAMIKTGVSTRSGILGKIFESQS